MASLTGRVTPGDTLTLPRKHAGRVWPLRRCRSCRALNCVLRGSVVAMANKLQGNRHKTDVASYRASSRPKTVESGCGSEAGRRHTANRPKVARSAPSQKNTMVRAKIGGPLPVTQL